MRRADPLTLGVLLLALAVWLVPLQLGPYADFVITDVPVYREAGERILAGEVPYRDFELEYPPLAAGLFALAAVGPFSYGAVFSVLMLVCLMATAVAAMAIAQALGMPRRRVALAGAAVAVAPLVVGSLVQTRYDLLLAALVAWTVWALVTGRTRLMWTLLAAAVLTKLVPLALAPVLVLAVRHRAGLRAALTGLGGALAGVGAVVAPFAVLGPEGAWNVVAYHLERPLQIESLGAAYLLALDALADIGLTVETSFGSQGLAGEGPRIVAAGLTAILAGLLAAVAIAFARGLRGARAPGDARLAVAACAATLAALLVGGKVLSPQFLVWLLPLGLLVAGRYGALAFAGTLAAMALTHAYFPHEYWDLVALEPLPVWLLVARDLTLVALLAACWPRRAIAEPLELRSAAPAGGALRPERAVSARYLAD
jgi:Glycosyltransferase family 87